MEVIGTRGIHLQGLHQMCLWKTEIIFFLNVDALADMWVYDENHSPEMIKGRGKYQLPTLPRLCAQSIPTRAPGRQRVPSPFLWGSSSDAQPSLAAQPGTATHTHLERSLSCLCSEGTAQTVISCIHTAGNKSNTKFLSL